MGWIIERPGGRYYLKYVDVDGTQRTRAAKGCTSKQQAAKLLAAIEFRILSDKVGVPQPVVITPEEMKRRTITLRGLGDAFTTRYADPRVKDIAEYREAQRTVLDSRVYPTLGDRVAASVTKREVAAFLAALGDGEDGYAAQSIRNTRSVLSKLYGWASAEGLIDAANPCRGIALQSAHEDEGPITPDKYLSKEEAQRLLARAESLAVVGVASWEGLMLPAMIATAIYAGPRKGELFGLKWTHVDLQRGQLTIAASYDGRTKSNKTRHVPISPRLAAILRGWKKLCPKTDAGLVFPILGNEGDMGESWQMLALEGVMKAAECHVPPKPWHGLRHSFASHFIMEGGNILTLKKLLGHAKLETTMIYAHLAPAFMAAEVARLDFSQPIPKGVADIAEARRKKLLEQIENDPAALWEALERVRARA